METYFLYNFILINCAIFSFIAEKIKNINLELLSRMVVFLTLTIPASLRYYTGTDYGNYVRMFSDDRYLESKEVLWVWLNRFVQFLNLDVQWVFVFSAILIYFPLCFKIKKKIYFLAIVIYIIVGFYFRSYSFLRQMISVSFIIWSFYHYDKKNYLRMVIMYILALGFHFFSIFLLPLFLFAKVKINFKTNTIPILLIFLSIFVIFNFDILKFLYHISDFFNLKYTKYFNMDYFTNKRELGTGLGILANLSFSFLAIFMYKRVSILYPDKVFLLNLSFLYICIYLLSTQIFILSRVRDFFTFVPLILSGYVILSCGKYKKIVLAILLFINLATFEKNIAAQNRYRNSNEIYPYYSIFYTGEIK